MPKTKVEIIKETMKFYSKDVSRRALDDKGGCFYKLGEKMCAVGRCMNEKAVFNFNGSIINYPENIENHLKDEYKGHSINFWTDLQSFHDNPDYWDINGITKEGKMYYKVLLEIYK